MLPDVFLQNFPTAFLVSSSQQGAHQQRLDGRGLSVSQFYRAIGFLDGLFREVLLQEHIREDRMAAPGVGIGRHRALRRIPHPAISAPESGLRSTKAVRKHAWDRILASWSTRISPFPGLSFEGNTRHRGS